MVDTSKSASWHSGIFRDVLAGSSTAQDGQHFGRGGGRGFGLSLFQPEIP